MSHKLILLALALLLISTVVFAATPDPKALVARVGDRSYDYKTYNDGFMAYLQYNKTDAAFTKQDSTRLNNQYWEELVGMYIYDQAIKEGMITVSNSELEAEIIKNVPDGVKGIPDLKSNGIFDKKKYQAALKNHPEFKKEVLDYTRSMYSYNKLINAIRNEASADPDSVAREWNKAHDTASATIIHFDYTKLTQITVSDEETRQYFDGHLEEYKKGPGRGYLFVRFAGALSKSEDKGETAKDNKIKSAALFARAEEIGLAKAAAELGYTTEQTGLFAQSDDIIPLVGRAADLKTFAFENETGALPPVYFALTGDVYVLELDRKVDEFYPDYEYKKAEINIIATRTKRMYLMDQYVQNFVKNLKPDEYLSVAERDSLAIIEATDITIDSEIKPLGRIPQLNQTILSNTVGSFSSVIEKDRHWYLARTNDRKFPDPEEWTKVRDSVIKEADEKVKQDHLNKWYMERRKNTELEDKRHEFYDILQMIKL